MKSKKKAKKAVAKKAAAKAPTKKTGVGVRPMGDRVLVKPVAPETTTSFGIIIPDNAKEKPEQGVVVAVGSGRMGDNNVRVPLSVKVGERIMFSKYGFDEVKINGTEYYLVREDSILAVLD